MHRENSVSINLPWDPEINQMKSSSYALGTISVALNNVY